MLGDVEDLEALVEMATGVERGDPDAAITILEFGDFQCPACQQFATLVKPQIDLAYIESRESPDSYSTTTRLCPPTHMRFWRLGEHAARLIRASSISGPSTINSSRTSRHGP